MHPLAWPTILLLLGLGLLILEVFVPSGGILGFLSLAAVAAGVVLAFYQLGTSVGFTLLTVATIAIPVVLTMAFRFWPQTPMGRRMLASLPTEEEVLPDNAQRRALRELVGKVGVARTLMLPSGAVEVGDQTVDAVSEGMPIEAGQTVRVIEVRGTQVLVRATTEELKRARSEEPADPMSQPIDGLDPFDDVLG